MDVKIPTLITQVSMNQKANVKRKIHAFENSFLPLLVFATVLAAVEGNFPRSKVFLSLSVCSSVFGIQGDQFNHFLLTFESTKRHERVFNGKFSVLSQMHQGISIIWVYIAFQHSTVTKMIKEFRETIGQWSLICFDDLLIMIVAPDDY